MRQTVEDVLAEHSDDLREAAVMVGSELAENLVKYGKPFEGEDSGKIQIEERDGVVKITSENATSEQEGSKVVDLVRTIAEAGDVQALYLGRLAEMAKAPSESASQLGLLRIAFEGGFKLDAEYDAPRLRVEARRRVNE